MNPRIQEMWTQAMRNNFDLIVPFFREVSKNGPPDFNEISRSHLIKVLELYADFVLKRNQGNDVYDMAYSVYLMFNAPL